ncbi:MAG: hypothetical protein KVP17_001419 [Porospora cf. gigantea B]|uniref:uncharacterized protein n=1 Tax=Porospora cf. gigantea B TaxID=2853592 RepID=UPI003571BF4A|nr:MAG: hypothetical protein KVP17_001419 [Porospora cf. gigantea B]
MPDANVRLNDSFPVASLLLGAASLAPLRDREADRAKDHPAGLPPGSLKRAGSLKGAGYLKKTHGSLKTAPSSLRKASGSLKKAHGSLKRAPSSLGKASGSLKKAHGFLKTAPSSLGKVHGSLKTAPSTLRKTSLKKAASGSNSLDRVNRRVAGSIDDVKGVGDPNRLQARRAVHRVQTLKAKSGSLTAGTLARVNKQASKGAKRMDLPWGAFYSLESKDAEKVKMKLVLRAPQLMHKPSDGSALFLAYIARQLLLGKASAIESDDRQHVLNNIEFQWPTVEVSEGLKLSGFNGSLVLDVEGTEKAVKKSIAQIVNRAKNPPKMSKVFFEVLKLQFLKERLDHVKNDGWGHEKDIQQHVDIVMSRTSDLWPTHEQVLKSCEGLDFAALKKTGLLKSVELLPGLGLVQCRSGKASEVRAMLKSMNPKGLKVVLNRVSFKSVREVAGGKTRPVHLVEQSTGLPSSDTSSTSVSFQVDSKDPANALFSEFVKYFVDESHKSSVQSHARTLETNTRLVRAANGVGETRDNQLAGAIHASYSLHTFYIPHQNVLQLVMRYCEQLLGVIMQLRGRVNNTKFDRSWKTTSRATC